MPCCSLGTSSIHPIPVLRSRGTSCVGVEKHVVLATVEGLTMCGLGSVTSPLWVLGSPTMKCKDWMNHHFDDYQLQQYLLL